MNPRMNIIVPAGPDTRAYAFNESEPDIDALRERPYVEPWRDRTERDYLERSHPGPTGAERAIEDRLWQQVSGKPLPTSRPSAQLRSDWSKLQASLDQSERLESQLFREVASQFGKVPANCQPLRREG